MESITKTLASWMLLQYDAFLFYSISMNNSGAVRQEQKPEHPEGIAELSETLFQAAPATLSVEVRSFLRKVLAVYGSPQEAAAWLQSPIAALHGAVPADELRKGDAQSLHEFWDARAKVYGY